MHAIRWRFSSTAAAMDDPLAAKEACTGSSPCPAALDSAAIRYQCAVCSTHIAAHPDIISKAFQGRHGRGFLFNLIVNVTVGAREERVLLTGRHTVADVACIGCTTNLGWVYFFASEEGQKYKEGKFILERNRVHRVHPWE